MAVNAPTNVPDSRAAFNRAGGLLRGRIAGGAVTLALGVSAAVAGAAPTTTESLLEPDQAFQPRVQFVAGENAGIEVTYRIAPGYYLYRGRFKASAQPALPLGDLEEPTGVEIDDPFVGRTRIFRDEVSVRLPLIASAAPGEYRLRLTAQGCAEERFCYRPFAQEAWVRVPSP